MAVIRKKLDLVLKENSQMKEESRRQKENFPRVPKKHSLSDGHFS